MVTGLQETSQTFIGALKMKFENLYTNLDFVGKNVAE
jgi:hypothetical protein